MRREALGAVLAVLLLCGSAQGEYARPESVQKLARAALAAGDLDRALAEIDRAIEIDPGFPPLWKDKARIHQLRGEHDLAIEAVRIVLAVDPGDPEALLLEGSSIMARGGDAAEIRKRFRALKQSKTLAETDAVRFLTISLEQSGGLVVARTFLEYWTPKGAGAAAITNRLLAADPRAPLETLDSLSDELVSSFALKRLAAAAGFALGRAQIQAGDAPRAVRSFTAALARNPDSAAIRRELGWAHRLADEPGNAADAWIPGLEIVRDPEAWVRWIAEAMFDARRYEDGLPYLRRSAERERSTMAWARYLAALEITKRGAERDEVAIAASADDPSAPRLGEALAAERQGDVERSFRALEDAIALGAPPQALRELQWSLAGELTRRQRWTEAERLYRSLLDQGADPGIVWSNIGWIAWARDDFDGALASFEKALRSDDSKLEKQRLVVKVTSLLIDVNRDDLAREFYPKWSAAPDWLGVALYLLDRELFDLAKRVFTWPGTTERAPRLVPPFLALAALGTGDPGTARDVLRAWLDDPPDPIPTVTVAGYDLEARPRTFLVRPARVFRALEAFLDRVFKDELSDLVFLLDEILALPGGAAHLKTRIVDWERRAEALLIAAGRPEEAKRYTERLLARNPKDGKRLYQLALRELAAGRTKEGRIALANAARSNPEPPLSFLIEAEQSALRADLGRAISHWERALEVDGSLDKARSKLISTLVRSARYSEAKPHLAYLEGRLARGETRLRDFVAFHRAELGDDEGALALFQEILQVAPENVGYAAEFGRILVRLCRAEEAADLLEPLIDVDGGEKIAQVLAEIGFALGRYEDVLRWTEAGLEKDAHATSLLAARAEAAEITGKPEIVVGASEKLLELEPEEPASIARYGAALVSLGRIEDARVVFTRLLEANPTFEPAVARLRELARLEGEEHEALDLARNAVEIQPASSRLRRELGLSYGEARKFVDAQETLRPLAELDPDRAVPTLYYDGLTTCAYAGSPQFHRFREHVAALAEDDRGIIGLPGSAGRTDRRVTLLVRPIERGTVGRMDAVLEEHGGRAVLVVLPESLEPDVPRGPTPEEIRSAVGSGRWDLAVDATSALLTEDIRALAASEHPDQRLSKKLGRIEEQLEALGVERPAAIITWRGLPHRVLSDRESAARVARTVRERFELVYLRDDPGFRDPETPSETTPFRRVPPSWTTETLLEELRVTNPAAESSLALAMVSAWHQQHSLANRWFRRAQALRADEAELRLRWAQSAETNGDVATAITQLRKLEDPSPAAERTLDRLEFKRRPWVRAEGGFREDNEDRRSYRVLGEGGVSLGNRVTLFASGGEANWRRTGFGELDASLVGGGFRLDPFQEVWLEGEAHRLDFRDSDVDDDWNGALRLRWPIRWWWPGVLSANGSFVIEGSREEIETFETVSSRVLDERISLFTYHRLAHMWDLYVNGHRDDRTDGNVTWRVDGRFLRRLLERPYLGLGYSGRYGDSDRDPPEYFAPEELQQHQGFASLRFSRRDFRISFSGAAGSARDVDSDWRFVWSGSGEIVWRPVRRLELGLNGGYFEGPEYREGRAWANARFRF